LNQLINLRKLINKLPTSVSADSNILCHLSRKLDDIVGWQKS